MAMTPNNPNTHPPQVPPPGYYSPAEDEISLIELWNVLAGRWRLIAATTLLATLIAIVYALTIPPLYKATAYFLPPSEQDVAPIGDAGVQDVSADEAYSLFKQMLSSKSLLDHYKSEHSLEGNPSLIINSDNKIPGSLNLSIESHDPDEAAGWVDGLSEMANKVVVEQFLLNLDNNLHHQIESIENTISSERKRAQKKREDRIETIESTISSKRNLAQKQREDRIVVIGESLEIVNAQIENTISLLQKFSQSYANHESTQQEILKTHLKLSNESTALQTEKVMLQNRSSDDRFISGLDDLEDEKVTLLNRTSDDPFIPGLSQLEKELVRLKSINISNTSINTYTLDQPALSSSYPIKSNRRRIITLGGIIGLMGGVFLAFLLNFIQNQKNRSEEG
jgi:chain length determinant protein (polysaccharide antigen chain regulator)